VPKFGHTIIEMKLPKRDIGDSIDSLEMLKEAPYASKMSLI
jgi:hypothetical protein